MPPVVDALNPDVFNAYVHKIHCTCRICYSMSEALKHFRCALGDGSVAGSVVVGGRDDGRQRGRRQDSEQDPR
jgi:hypothetical protein